MRAPLHPIERGGSEDRVLHEGKQGPREVVAKALFISIGRTTARGRRAGLVEEGVADLVSEPELSDTRPLAAAGEVARRVVDHEPELSLRARHNEGFNATSIRA